LKAKGQTHAHTQYSEESAKAAAAGALLVAQSQSPNFPRNLRMGRPQKHSGGKPHDGTGKTPRLVMKTYTAAGFQKWGAQGGAKSK